MRESLKLFVWEDVFRDWTPGLAVAIAPNKEEAIKLIKAEGAADYEGELSSKEPEILPLNKEYAVYVLGGG